jgi:hypothetical protein
MWYGFEEDESLFERVIFSDGHSFCVSGKVNTQNMRVWGSEQPHDSVTRRGQPQSQCVLCYKLHENLWSILFHLKKS